MKPMPMTFNESVLAPAATLPPTGCGLIIVNVSVPETVPFGFVTRTYGLPTMAMALAGMLATSWVELTNTVDTLFRLKLTCDPCTKPFPFTVRVNAAPPVVALLGETFETDSGTTAGPIVSVTAFEVPPPGTPFEGFVTEILAVPWVAISAPGI